MGEHMLQSPQTEPTGDVEEGLVAEEFKFECIKKQVSELQKFRLSRKNIKLISAETLKASLMKEEAVIKAKSG